MSGRHALTALLLASCTSHVPLGADDPRAYPDGAAIVHCGAVDCRPDQVCCSTTCGICATPSACSVSLGACPDASTVCTADRITLTGADCGRWAWNGTDCTERRGCDCTGEGCASTRTTYVDCMDAHTSCWSRVCDFTGRCPSGYFCGRARCDSPTGVCTPAPIDDCVSAPRVASCACDGLAYASRCEAQRVGQTLTAAPTCGVCNAPAVTITPGCSTVLGWAWDGARCVAQTGCACVGACDRLEATESDCRHRYEGVCGPLFPCGATSCARGREICVLGATTSTCMTTPSTCDCTCVASIGIATTGCTDDGQGGVTATTP